MAGSYRHVVDGNTGKLLEADEWHVENLGDAYEAIEEMFGMIWYLATTLTLSKQGAVDMVEEARQNYKEGIALQKETVNED